MRRCCYVVLMLSHDSSQNMGTDIISLDTLDYNGYKYTIGGKVMRVTKGTLVVMRG